LVGDAKRLPFRDASVDLVISNSLIHHIPDPGRVFREVARIGRAILIRDLVRPESESEVDALVKRYGRGWSGLQQQLFADSLHAALTLSEVRELLDRSGLASASLKQITDRHWSAERGAR
jgi:ubiquinone/menaquinone biosynthesis C-methylase UbiE